MRVGVFNHNHTEDTDPTGFHDESNDYIVNKTNKWWLSSPDEYR